MRFYDIRYACLPLLLRRSTDKLPMPTTLQHILHPRSSPPPSPHLTSFPYDLPRKTKLSPTPRSNNRVPSHPHPQPHQCYHPSPTTNRSLPTLPPRRTASSLQTHARRCSHALHAHRHPTPTGAASRTAIEPSEVRWSRKRVRAKVNGRGGQGSGVRECARRERCWDGGGGGGGKGYVGARCGGVRVSGLGERGCGEERRRERRRERRGGDRKAWWGGVGGKEICRCWGAGDGCSSRWLAGWLAGPGYRSVARRGASVRGIASVLSQRGGDCVGFVRASVGHHAPACPARTAFLAVPLARRVG